MKKLHKKPRQMWGGELKIVTSREKAYNCAKCVMPMLKEGTQEYDLMLPIWEYLTNTDYPMTFEACWVVERMFRKYVRQERLSLGK